MKHLSAVLMAVSIAICCVSGNYMHAQEQDDLGPQPRHRGEVSFGERQLQQLLADRPAMRPLLEANELLAQEMVRLFNGKESGFRVHWQAAGSYGFRPAYNNGPYRSWPAFITMTDAADHAADDKVIYALFELYNVQNTKAFRALTAQSRKGEITGNAYAMGAVRLEFEALTKTRRFLQRHPIAGTGSYHKWLLSDKLQSWEAYLRSSWRHQVQPGNYDYFKLHHDQSQMDAFLKEDHPLKD